MKTILLRESPPEFCIRCGRRHFIAHEDGWQCDLRYNGCGQIYYQGQTLERVKHRGFHHLRARRN